jgi:hypothetical protein
MKKGNCKSKVISLTEYKGKLSKEEGDDEKEKEAVPVEAIPVEVKKLSWLLAVRDVCVCYFWSAVVVALIFVGVVILAQICKLFGIL